MPSLKEWWDSNPQFHNQPEASAAKEFLKSHKANSKEANAAFLEQEKLEEEIRKFKKPQDQ
ncbi:MAG: hypothetical protein HC833_20575 [Leptolyngbyaceae cyanobacterium RM1_406_9]|nr:hypothetical protein [Leptolyngbyaceae cyanobacterium SM1_4_3]NJO75932.1 hypothetical protein [Leptolyngbyaceae cyanobacterium RM1_406_9]